MPRQLKEVANFVIKLDRNINSDVTFIMSNLTQFMSDEAREYLEKYMFGEVYFDCDYSEDIEPKFNFEKSNQSLKYNDTNIVNTIRKILVEYLNDENALNIHQLGLLLTLMYSLNWKSIDSLINKVLDKPSISNSISDWKYVFATIFGIKLDDYLNEKLIKTLINIGRGYERIDVDNILKYINGELSRIDISPLKTINVLLETNVSVQKSYRTRFEKLPPQFSKIAAIESENLYTLRKYYTHLTGSDFSFFENIEVNNIRTAQIYSNPDETKFFIIIDSIVVGSDLNLQRETYQQILNFKSNNKNTTVHFTQELHPGKFDEVTESIILSNFGIVHQIYYPEYCKLVEISSDIADEFYNYHNIMYSPKTLKNAINIGLVCDNTLVYCASFIKPRFNSSFDYEMVRSNSKTYSAVPGGLKIIVDHFVKKYQPESIVAYSNNMYCSGERYSQAGFKEVKDLQPTRYCFSKTDPFNIKYCTNKSIDEIKSANKLFIESLGSKQWVYKK